MTTFPLIFLGGLVTSHHYSYAHPSTKNRRFVKDFAAQFGDKLRPNYFAVTAYDLKNGAEPGWEHGLAALYIGYTVAYGHYTIRWLDGHAAHRLAGGPPPAKPPRYGMARARHEGWLWLRTLLGAAVACALLQGAVWYVGADGDVSSLRSFQWTALRVVGIHGLIALTYLIRPKKGPASPPEVPAERRKQEAQR